MSRRAAVLGSPISHSLSPVLHRAAYQGLGLDWTYDAIDVGEDQLTAFVDGCGPQWAGLSLTMPLKTVVLPLLDHASEVVEVTGAANTVVFAADGRHGHNTDVAGMVRAIVEAGGEAPRARGLILGGGATARSALAALARLGVGHVDVAVRDGRRAAELDAVAELLTMAWRPVPWEEAAHHLDADVVIATVPRGSADHLASSVPPSPGVLLDVAYGDAPTPLARAWRSAHGATADGVDLLLWQAVEQVHLMTGRSAPVEAMRAAVRAVAPG